LKETTKTRRSTKITKKRTTTISSSCFFVFFVSSWLHLAAL